jgi:uncharacterized YigZ family protein
MTARLQPMPETQRYPIPAQRQRSEEEIMRSRFITTIGHAPTVEQARQLIATVSAEFADASHHCWAYVIGPPGSTSQVGLSDDGEPHGVAGRPMLTVLLHSGIGDVCAVVTRYFGGTLLGKGGLVKAYSGGVQLALQGLPTIERVPRAELLIVVDYNMVTPVQRLFATYEVEVLGHEFATDVSYQLKLPVAQMEHFCHALTELTRGQALVEIVSQSDWVT